MKFSLIATGIFSLGIGMFVGAKFFPNTPPTPLRTSTNVDNLNLINPIYGFDLEIDKSDPKITLIEQDVKTLIGENDPHTSHQSIGIYFRELSYGGTVFGIHSDLLFTPASLFKLPLMMAYFKQAQKDPDFLQKKITYTTDRNFNNAEYFKDIDFIKPGTTYTIEELIRFMIVSSDNEATILLKNNIDPSITNQTYRDLGIDLPENSPNAEFVSVKNYASFFRILYNATYLSEEYSAKALEILTQTDFAQGLSKPLPPDIKVADKFGERTDTETNTKQLHDCGIIYYPHHPYILCIMTKGDNFEQMSQTIQDVSKTVYEGMKKIYSLNKSAIFYQ